MYATRQRIEGWESLIHNAEQYAMDWEDHGDHEKAKNNRLTKVLAESKLREEIENAERGFDQATFDMSGGGNADTNYCSTDILANRPIPPYEIVGFHQH